MMSPYQFSGGLILTAVFLVVLALLVGCIGDGQQPPPRHDGENEAGSINCTIDVRNCEPGMKR